MEKKWHENIDKASIIQLITLILMPICSAYIINYKPKIGVIHVWLCSAFGVVLVAFSIWAIVVCSVMLKKKEGKKGPNIALILLMLITLTMGVSVSSRYCKDLINGSTTITTNKYMAVMDVLYFQKEDGAKERLLVLKKTASELMPKDNDEFDSESNLFIHQDPISVTYYPNSKIIVKIEHSENK